MTNTNEDLGKRIEQMIAEHIAATRRVAQEAVERGLTASGAAPTVPAQRGRARARESGKRRATAEIAALGERFYHVVCSKPGETMTVLAAQVGASPRELQRAVAGLKEAGRVRAVGQRSQTRYFPLANSSAA
jgi:predicted Zn-dependent protease